MPSHPHPFALNMTPRRLMAFIDGENLVCRYEDMLKDGCEPRSDLVHEQGTLVWHSSFLHQASFAHGYVLRATYYTSAIGSEDDREGLRDRIRDLTFSTYPQVDGSWPDRLTPGVFRREKSTQRSKGVDITLTIDVLTQVWNDNVDTVLLLTGDGDYVPLVQEVVRAGKLVLVAAFSKGLSPALKRAASDLYLLENTAFKARG